MKLKVLILMISVLTAAGTELYSQIIGSEINETPKMEFIQDDWNKIQNRWKKFQPVVDLITKTGDTISGQVMFANQEEITVYPGLEILPHPDQVNKIVHVDVGEIQSILIQKGGYGSKGFIIGGLTLGGAGFVGGLILGQGWTIAPAIILGTAGIVGGGLIGSKMQKNSRSSQFELNTENPEYAQKLEEISSSAIYSDSLLITEDLYQAVEASRPMARAFPHKHLRISVALSAGPNTIQNDMTKMLESTTLPAITDYRPGPLAIEFLDVSWRFSDRYIVGAQFHLNLDSYASVYSFGDGSPYLNYYDYSIYPYEGRFYFDYVLNPVDRFFTKPYEFLVGGGLIVGGRSTNFSYNMIGGSEYVSLIDSPGIYGMQLRSAAHFYPFPGLSLFAGLEANLYHKMTLPGFVLPTSDPLVDIDIPDLSLQFSSVRIKAGASIYF